MKQTIGEFLATLRKANGYTQQEIADKLGISNKTLSNWECDKSLPDVLLLPTLAEIYGVTVDEILAGERLAKEDMPLSLKSERNIYKNKLARFSNQLWILIGVSIVGGILGLCSVLGLGFVPLVVGLVALLASVFALLVLWRSSEAIVDNESEFFGVYCILLRRKVSFYFYLASAVCFLISVIALFQLSWGTFLTTSKLSLAAKITIVFSGVLVSVALFLIGWFIYRKSLVKWGDEKFKQHTRQSGKYVKVVALVAIVPIILGVVLAVVFGDREFSRIITIYENDNVDEFIRHIESMEYEGQEYFFPLSKLSKSATDGAEFDLGDGFSATYHYWYFTLQHTVPYKGGYISYNYRVTTFDVNLGNEIIRVFNARYYPDKEGIHNEDTFFYKRKVYYAMVKQGEGLAYIHKIVSDYSSIGYTAASTLLVLDLVVCAFLCAWKRYEYAIKL